MQPRTNTGIKYDSEVYSIQDPTEVYSHFLLWQQNDDPFSLPRKKKEVEGRHYVPFLRRFNQILELGNFCLFSCQNSFVYVRGIIDY